MHSALRSWAGLCCSHWQRTLLRSGRRNSLVAPCAAPRPAPARLAHNNSQSYTPLLKLLQERRLEAKRSVLVQVKGESSAEDLYLYCAGTFGPVKGLHYHQNNPADAASGFTNFFIVEFDEQSSVDKLLSSCGHKSDAASKTVPPVPVYSPFVWLSGSSAGSCVQSTAGPTPVYVPVRTSSSPDLPAKEAAQQAETFDEQVMLLWKEDSMTDTSTRLRFLVCRQVELAISGMFPHASVLPFGSSVNSFGKHSCDLDMVLVLDPVREPNNCRLVFHAKGAVHGGERAQTQRYCDEISKLIQAFLPGCQDVQKILHARVPLIKYRQQLAGLECDLQMTSESGIHMSRLLHLWGGTDWRVRPLVYFVRKWARTRGLVKNERPTSYLTNFTVTMLVVFYLQHMHSMLPTLGRLNELAAPTDSYSCEDDLSVKFLSCVDGIKDQVNQLYDAGTTIEELLMGFFQFYAKFDFTRDTICLEKGNLIPKNKNWRHSSSMDIINPLESHLNVSYNVGPSAVNSFRENCALGARKMERIQEVMESHNVLHMGGVFWLLGNESTPKFSHPSIKDIGLSEPAEEAVSGGVDKVVSAGAVADVAETRNTVLKRKQQSLDLNSIFRDTPLKSSSKAEKSKVMKKIASELNQRTVGENRAEKNKQKSVHPKVSRVSRHKMSVSEKQEDLDFEPDTGANKDAVSNEVDNPDKDEDMEEKLGDEQEQKQPETETKAEGKDVMEATSSETIDRLRCTQCEFLKFKNIDQWKNHVVGHWRLAGMSNDYSLSCFVAGCGWSPDASLSFEEKLGSTGDHFVTVHSFKQALFRKCDICQLEFTEERKYSTHMRKHEETLTCELCNKKLTGRFWIQKHMKTCVGDSRPSWAKKGPETNPGEDREVLEVYGKEYDVHWGTVTNTWTNVTRIVARAWIEGKAWAGKGDTREEARGKLIKYLKDHVKKSMDAGLYQLEDGELVPEPTLTEKNKKLSCDKCGTHFSKKSNLDLHMFMHRSNKSFSKKGN